MNRECFAIISPSLAADLYRRHVTGLEQIHENTALEVEGGTGDEVPDHARKRPEMASGPPVSADPARRAGVKAMLVMDR